MKRLLFGILAILFSLSILSFRNSVSNITFSESATPLKNFHLQGSTTLSGGCVVTYNLILDVNLIPPRFNSLTGTISMSGNCSGNQTITVTELRGTIDDVTKETSDFEIDDQLFQSDTHQTEFESHLQNEINNNKDDIFSDRGN